MPYPRAAFLSSIAMFMFGCIGGCSYTPAPVAPDASGTSQSIVAEQRPAQPEQKSTQATPVSGPPAVLTVQLNKLDEEGGWITEFVRKSENPDAGVITEQVNSLDWQNPKLEPVVSLAFKITSPDQRDAMQRKGALTIQRGLKSEDVDKALRAIWLGGEGARCTPPLESLDQAVGLLISFRNDDEKWRTMAEWAAPQ